MGYNVRITDSNVVIPNAQRNTVLQRWKDLNGSKNDHLKRGGSWGGGAKSQSWFSWMPADYDKTCTTPEQVLDHLGFECVTQENGDISINSYDSKTGQEDLFFQTVSDLIPKSNIDWIGEDGAQFRWKFSGKTLKVQQGKTVFD